MNTQLVKGAAYAADKFNDIGGAVNRGAGPGINRQALAAQRKAQARADEAKVEGYMRSMPADFDVSQIPQKYRENISKFLTDGKKQYANAAMNIGDYEVGSDGYIEMVSRMNKVKNSFHNLKTQFDQFGAGKKDLTNDMLEGMYSKGNDPDEISLLTSVYTDELDIQIGEDGNIGFMGGDGSITNLGDLPDYFNKDYTSGDAIMSMANGIYKSGNPLNNSTRMMYENKLYQMIERGGIPTLKSLARDDFFNRGGIPNITDEELNDPMQRDAVEKKLVDFYMGVFNTHAKNGATNRAANSGGSSSDSGYRTVDSWAWDGDLRYRLDKAKDPTKPDIWTYEDGNKYYVYPDGTKKKIGGGGSNETTQEETQNSNTETETSNDSVGTMTVKEAYKLAKEQNPDASPKELAAIAQKLIKGN